MAKSHSAGILLYRYSAIGALEVFLAHPGGPFWSKRDDGAWSIPKGLAEEDEADFELVARREFAEEIGIEISISLQHVGEFKQPSGKIVHAWIGSQDIDESSVVSNTFEMEWPPKSGKVATFPEIDRAKWFNLPTSFEKILKGQRAIIEEATKLLQYDDSLDKRTNSLGQIELF